MRFQFWRDFGRHLRFSGDDQPERYRWLQRCWIVSWLLLLGVTWRLWLPPNEFPAVPVVPIAAFPAVLEWSLLVGVVTSLVVAGLTLGRRSAAVALWVFIGCGVALVVLNQHRFQPWFYQAIILALLFATTDRRRALAAAGWLAIGVYFYSSLGKFDFQFIHTVGQQFLATAAGLVGVNIETWSEPLRWGAALGFPIVELLVAIGLVFRSTRQAAASLAIAMHAAVILLLSPLGLGHQPGVLAWNAAMIGQALVLFLWKPAAASRSADWSMAGGRQVALASSALASRESVLLGPSWLALAVVWLAMLLPLTERFGIWDHWPSWALYSPHSSRVRLQIHGSSAGKLPVAMRERLSVADEQGWQTLPLDRWSIEALGVPLYPQSRFQLGVAQWLVDRYKLDRGTRMHLRGAADRWTGAREDELVMGRMGIDHASDRFWLNVQPRSVETR